jgi:hypothetical protein
MLQSKVSVVTVPSRDACTVLSVQESGARVKRTSFLDPCNLSAHCSEENCQ